MPLFKRVTPSEKFTSVSTLIESNVQIEADGGAEEFMENFPLVGEIVQSFDTGDGGWHLVWLDEAFHYDDQSHAYLMIGARWVARPLTRGQVVPINIRFVPDVSLIQKGNVEIEKLPFASKGTAILI